MKNKVVRVALAATVVMGVFSVPTFAATWQQDAQGSWQYLADDGTVEASRFVKGENATYYIGDNGYMLTDSLLAVNEDYYYFDENGVMLRNNWKQLADENGDLHWYYFGENGKAFRNSGSKFYPKNVNGVKYAFTGDGKMLTGFIGEDGEVVENDNNGYAFLNAKYFFDETGAMCTSSWLETSTTLAPNMRTEHGMKDYSNYAQMWLYFDENGKIVKAKNNEREKVMTINGVSYAFDENGVMIPSFSVNNTEVKATSSDARLKISENDTNGAVVKDRWTWAVPTDVLSEDEFNSQEYSWWRSDSNGKLLKNGIRSVNGKKYAFDGIGRMQAGFVIMLENGKFGIKYDVNEWNREDFLQARENSVIPAIDRGNLYVFNSDEFNDGSMMSGGEYTITLNDGEAVFGISRSGKVYGNRSTLQRVKNKYYFNGLRLAASEDIGYGIVDINTGAGRDYVVVDTKGTVIKGNRRIIRDREGAFIVIQNGRFVARVLDGDAPRWKNGRYWRYDSSLKGNARYVQPVPYSLDNTDEDFVVFEH